MNSIHITIWKGLVIELFYLLRQIAEFCELFPTDCIAEFIHPVTYTLANDKIAEVRMTAIKAV